MSIPLDVRRNLWSWYYGRQAFDHCRTTCEYILNQGLTEEAPLYYPLNVAAVVCYGRPFKKSNGLDRLPLDIIPACHAGTHKEIIAMRDTIYAHVDAASSPNVPENVSSEVVYRVRPGTRDLMVMEFQIKPDGIRRMSALSKILVEKCDYHVRRIFGANRKEFPDSVGTYRIGVAANEPEFQLVRRGHIPVDP